MSRTNARGNAHKLEKLRDVLDIESVDNRASIYCCTENTYIVLVVEVVNVVRPRTTLYSVVSPNDEFIEILRTADFKHLKHALYFHQYKNVIKDKELYDKKKFTVPKD